MGHIARVCTKEPTRLNNDGPSVNNICKGNEIVVNTVLSYDCRAIWVQPVINGEMIKMQLDTGSAALIISLTDYKRYFNDLKLQNSSTLMKTYSGEKLNLLGFINVKVCLNGGEVLDLKLHVVDVRAPPLF